MTLEPFWLLRTSTATTSAYAMLPQQRATYCPVPRSTQEQECLTSYSTPPELPSNSCKSWSPPALYLPPPVPSYCCSPSNSSCQRSPYAEFDRAQSFKILVPPDQAQLTHGGALEYQRIINYPRANDKEKQRCVMCGLPPGSVCIPRQNKDVCKDCDRSVWVHESSKVYFKFCKGCKRFLRLLDFRQRMQAAKCDKCRQRGRQSYQVKKVKDESPSQPVRFSDTAEGVPMPDRVEAHSPYHLHIAPVEANPDAKQAPHYDVQSDSCDWSRPYDQVPVQSLGSMQQYQQMRWQNEYPRQQVSNIAHPSSHGNGGPPTDGLDPNLFWQPEISKPTALQQTPSPFGGNTVPSQSPQVSSGVYLPTDYVQVSPASSVGPWDHSECPKEERKEEVAMVGLWASEVQDLRAENLALRNRMVNCICAASAGLFAASPDTLLPTTPPHLSASSHSSSFSTAKRTDSDLVQADTSSASEDEDRNCDSCNKVGQVQLRA